MSFCPKSFFNLLSPGDSWPIYLNIGDSVGHKIHMWKQKKMIFSYRERKKQTLHDLKFCWHFSWRKTEKSFKTHVRFAVGNRFESSQIFLLMHHYGVINIALGNRKCNKNIFTISFCVFALIPIKYRRLTVQRLQFQHFEWFVGCRSSITNKAF